MATAKEVAGNTDNAGEVARLVDALADSRIASCAAILVIALCCFLPGFNTLPPLDSDEPRFVVAARQMVATGDLAMPRLQGTAPAIRPLGIYWLQAAAAVLSGHGTRAPFWVYRVPSLLGAIAAALLTWWTGLAFGRPRAALLAACFTATSVALTMEAHFARPDAVLLAAIVLAEGALARLWLQADDRPDYRLAFLFWTGLGAGILLKGLVAPVVVLLTVAGLCLERRSLRWLLRLAPLPGLSWMVVILTPWAIAAIDAWQRGAPGGLSGDLSISGGSPISPLPPGSYLLLLSAIFGPGTSFFLLGLPWLAAHFRRPVVLFGVAWAIPFWFVAELEPVKLPQLLLPIFPAIAILAATAVDLGEVEVKGRVTWVLSLGPLVWPPLLAVLVPLGFIIAEDRIPFVALVPLLGSAVMGPIAWRWLRRGEAVAAAGLSALSAILLYFGIFGIALPDLTAIRLSERLIAAGRSAVKCSDPKFAAAGFAEQSLVFLAGDVRLVPAAAAAAFLNGGGCRVAFVEAHQVSSFRQRAEDLGVDVLDRGRVTGVNLGKSRQVDLRVYAVREGAE